MSTNRTELDIKRLDYKINDLWNKTKLALAQKPDKSSDLTDVKWDEEGSRIVKVVGGKVELVVDADTIMGAMSLGDLAYKDKIEDSDIEGTISVEHGGTGSDSPEGARDSLDVYSRTEVDELLSHSSEALADHIADHENPHQVTAYQVGAYTKEETEDRIEEALSGEIGGWLGNLTVEEVNALTDHKKGDSATITDTGTVNPGSVYVTPGDDVMWVDNQQVWQIKTTGVLHHDDTLKGIGNSSNPLGVDPQKVVTAEGLSSYVEQQADTEEQIDVVTSVAVVDKKIVVKKKTDVGLYYMANSHRMGFGTYWE